MVNVPGIVLENGRESTLAEPILTDKLAGPLVAGNSTILIDGGTGNSYIDFSAEL
jgi:hypothetical protein